VSDVGGGGLLGSTFGVVVDVCWTIELASGRPVLALGMEKLSGGCETGTGVCDCRSTLGRADDGVEEGSPVRLIGPFGAKVFLLF
jgi:hypothetical protein